LPESTSAAHKTTQRVIKKYPNRRLYDTDTSTYITLSEEEQEALKMAIECNGDVVSDK
jgi:polyhydroxyalkanoate synthesis regulator protein